VSRHLAIRAGALALAALLPASPLAAQYPTQPPAPLPLTPAALPPFQEATLANGVRVILVESHRNPTVAFRLALPAGDASDPAGKTGLASMVAALLTKGAGERSAEQISAAIESAGGSIFAVTDDDFLSIAGSVLSESAPLAFEILGDVVARPAFAESEFELARTQTLSGLQLSAADPGFLAGKFFRAGLYGAHPYGATASAATTRAITRADLQAFHRNRVRPRGALLVVAGDITMAQLRTLADKAFAGWTGAPATAPAMPAPPARSSTEILLVHRPGSVQSNLVAGNLAIGPADSSRLAASIVTSILGGGADARLFMILREQKGWTYGSYARLTRPRGIGRFEATAEVRTEVTDSALVELLAQLERITTEPIGAPEFEAKRGAMVGAFPLSIETPQALAERVASVQLYGLPRDYLQTYRTTMSAITVAQGTAAAKRVIRPKQTLGVVVGDGAKIHDKLAAIAPVRIVNADGDVLQASDLAPKVLAAAFDARQLRASRDSFAVMVQGNAMGASVVSLESANGGWVVRENTSIMGGMVSQQTTLTTDAALVPSSLEQGMSMQGQPLKTSVAFANGKATGSAQTMSQQGPQTIAVNTDLPVGTIASDALQAALPAFRWSEGATYTVNVFAAGKGTVQPVTLKVVGSETVTVPAGTFDSWKIEQTGGEATAMFYVAKESRRVVKIAPVGQPLELQLVK
jgi:predicted Zn-dependent peptidase